MGAMEAARDEGGGRRWDQALDVIFEDVILRRSALGGNEPDIGVIGEHSRYTLVVRL
jgi:hypothetical protein